MSTDAQDPPKLPVLMSYAYLRGVAHEKLERVLSDPRIEYLIDSGAFSSLNSKQPIELDKYMAWLERYDDHVFGAIQLDELGDPEQSERNLYEMLDAGLEPIPVHVWGDDQARMNELFELSDWVALGGLRRPGRGWGPKSYLKQKMKWAAGRDVHWLGYTNKKMVAAYRPFSVDSSNVTEAAQWGEAYFYQGKGRMDNVLSPRKRRGQGLTGPPPLTPQRERTINRLGFDVDDWHDERKWRSTASQDGLDETDFLARELNWNSYVRYSLDLRDKLGTRYFLACDADDYDILSRQLRREGIER